MTDEMSIEPIGGHEGVSHIETPESHTLLVDGCSVPLIKLHKQDDGLWNICLDERFGVFDVTDEELNKWSWFIANCLAVAGGYTCFGPNGKPINPYARGAYALAPDELRGHNEQLEAVG